MSEHVLLVDDEEAIRWSLSEYLSGHGYQISLADSEDEALSLASLRPPDLVVSDLMLKDGSGLSLLKKLKERAPGISPFCILMTGFGTLESAVEALRFGVDDFLTKPFSLQDLQRALNGRVAGARSDAHGSGRGDWKRLKGLKHELAAPLARAAAYVAMLDQGLFGPLGSVQESKVKSLQRSVARLAHTVSSVQSPESGPMGRVRLERIRPDSQVKLVLEDFDLDFERRGLGVVHCVHPGLPEVLADRQGVYSALEYVFSQLLLSMPAGATLRLWWEMDSEGTTLNLGPEPREGGVESGLPALEAPLLERCGLALTTAKTDGRWILRFLNPRPEAGVGG